MRRAPLVAMAFVLIAARAGAQTPAGGARQPAAAGGAAVAREAARSTASPATSAAADSLSTAALQAAIDRHLGRPYVWGACGLKSYDCSGFVWRVMLENGILMKRTTARKFYLVLPKVSEADRWTFGNVVLFSNRKHCGIVRSRDTFYHAQMSQGTKLSRFDPLWRGRISGIRALPRTAPPDTLDAD